MADEDKSLPAEENPRHGMAQRYMQAAHDELAAKEAAKPRSQRTRPSGEPSAVTFLPSISLSTILHVVLLMPALTFAGLATLWCYVLLDTYFIAGRIVVIPTGIVLFATASYASAFYIGIIESTSHGHTSPDDTLAGGWQDWFWTMPSTLGMLVIAIGVGYGISVVTPQETVRVTALTAWLAYPILQLSSLETASPLAPLSIPILRTLVTRPIAWILFYANSLAVFAIVVFIAKAAWRDPPYFTVAVMGPILAVVLLIYAWLLGQLARWLALRGT